jgi:aspartyl-tRNA(Asn)/glutamyl-tRNA(Gln) amidotransferase subunit A
VSRDDRLCFLSIAEMGDLVRRREVSPGEVVEAHLARIERVGPKLGAFITVMADEARKAAADADAEIARGRHRGPLHGVPIGVKDIFDTAGVLTTHGSSFYRDNVPAADADSVRRLREAGAVLIGKCNTHEFAAGSTTNNPWYGACRNPWNLERSPGGSSGGSASAVAAFLCAGATGTDTGGSIRSPAHCCGIVGLKPTHGRVSLRGIYPNAWSLDHPGPITRTVRDAALLLHAMAGHDPHDPTSADLPVPDFTAELEAGVAGMRIARCPDLHYGELDAAVAQRLDAAADVLERLGATVETVPFPLKGDLAGARKAIASAEFITLHRERLAVHPEGYGADVRARLLDATRVTVDDYVRACEIRAAVRHALDVLLKRIDALILPVAPCEAPLLDGTSWINGAPVSYGETGVAMRAPINVTGLPALALPMGTGATGLPLGLQIVGPRWDEAKVLRIGRAYEAATPELRPSCRFGTEAVV